MNFARLKDPELLWLAISVEDECARRFVEMAGAVRGADERRAQRFQTMAQEEEEHAAELLDAWRKAGAEFLPDEEVRRWLRRRLPEIARPWDRWDDDVEGALERARAMEKTCIWLYRVAARLAQAEEIRELFRRLAESEREHAGHLN